VSRCMAAAKLMKRILSAIGVTAIAMSVHAAPSVELIAPRGGAVLEGGRETTLTWSASSLPARAEEWEAFLSFDGGHYYATRITPHLDAATHSFHWRVPNVAASDVRILLRVGNEREETAIEFPETFRIVPASAPLAVTDLHATITEAAGESAFPTSPPVVEWVSGDRRGAGLVTSRHRDAKTLHRHDVSEGIAGGVVIHLSNVSSVQRPAAFAGINRSASAARAVQPRIPRPLLLLLTRLNV